MLVDIPILSSQLSFIKENSLDTKAANVNIIELINLPIYNDLKKQHLVNFYGVWLQKKGKSLHKFKDEVFKVSAGQAVLFKEHQVHQLLDFEGTEGYFLVISHTFYDTFKQGLNVSEFHFYNENTQTKPVLNLSDEQLTQLDKILEAILLEYMGKKNTEILWAFTHALLLNLERMISVSSYHQTSHSKEITHQFETLIQKSFKQHLPVSAYADALNISPNYLNQLCKKKFGKNAKKLIDDRLLIEAKRALFSGSLSISEIAFELNFKDASYFSRFFKKQTGKTPETFRNKHILE